jgi:aconitate hydratase
MDLETGSATLPSNDPSPHEPPKASEATELVKGPNIAALPTFDPLPDRLEGPVLLKMGDDISTDEILPAGAKVLPFRSNIPAISRFAFSAIDETYHDRAIEFQKQGSFVVGGMNYGQGSSREHADLVPRFLGLRAVLAKKFARIHWQNLINFGVLPLQLADPADWDKINRDDQLIIENVHNALKKGARIRVKNQTRSESFEVEHSMSSRQVDIVLAGGLIDTVGR